MTANITWIPEAVRYGEDPETGAEIEQLTSEPVTSTNIYCEQRYASADGKHIAISRKPFGQPTEIWVCNMETLRLCRMATGTPIGANGSKSAVYYSAAGEQGSRLMRLDLTELTTREVLCFEKEAAPGNGTLSPDEHWLVGGPFHVRDNIFSLRRVNLETGDSATLCDMEDMFNPHLQFDPAGGKQILVQINRGGRRTTADGRAVLGGPLGPTLCTVDVDSGKLCSLPVGRPHTPPISGHECWVGQTGRLIFTAGQYKVTASAHVTLRKPPDNDRTMPAAAIYSVAPGDKEAKVTAQGLLFNHLAASDDGRFFIADDHATGRIYVGSMATGEYRGLCDSSTRQGTCQHSHVHAYMTPDNRHVIFNSIATGSAQVYAARIPNGFLEKVLAIRD